MMADVKSMLESLCVKHYDDMNKGDIVSATHVFAPDACLMPNGGKEIVGRPAIQEVLPGLYPRFRFLQFEKFEYFELMGEDTAYTIDYTKRVDEAGKTQELFHGSRLWRKIGDEWFVERQLFNNRQDTPESRIRKHIEGRCESLCAALDRQDYDTASGHYTEDAMFAPHGAKVVRGREALRDMMRSIVSDMSHMSVEETSYFRLLDENNAYSNSHIKSVDDKGKLQSTFRNAFIWTKLPDGEWYVKSDICNDRPWPKDSE